MIDKLFMAAANPDDNDSILLKSALSKLHSNTNAIEASFSHGNMNLKKIQELLDSKEQTMMLAVNTPNHSMLIGKVILDGNTLYYFYDPNFGLFSFNQSEPLFLAVKKFMVDNKMSVFYSALGAENEPIFTTIEMNTEDMANVPVGNHLMVSNLSETDSLSLASGRQQHIDQLIERQDLVDMDAQLKTSLAILDAQQWGISLDKSIEALSSKYQLGKEWLPLFSNIEKIDDDHYRIQFIHSENPGLTLWVETTDKTLIEFHDYYENQILTFEKFYYFEGNEIRPKGGDVEVVPIDGLNAGIAIQSLIQWASDKNRNEGSNKGNSPDLEFALKMQTYVSYSMMAQGAMNDAMKVTELVQKVLADDTKMAIEAMDGFSSSLVRNTNEGLGVIFNGAVVGLDLYELSHAENESQKVIFGTQLAFDSAGLITSTAGLGAGVLGASSTSAVLGGAGVLISGLGIGFAGLARNFSDIGKDAKSVGRYFYLLDKAYQGNGYDYLSDKKVLVPRFGAIFKVIDLREKQVEFDSQYIYRTSPNSAGGGRKNYIFWAGDFPVMVHDRNQAINIRNGIGYSQNIRKLEYSNLDAIVLPVVPKSYIKYDYNLWPGATTRHDSGFDVIRRLEENDDFDYDFYIFPSENTITQIYQEYVNTTIEVKLDHHNRHLVVPKLASEWHGKINYSIRGDGGQYKISLQYGIGVKLFDDASHKISHDEYSLWVIDIGQLNTELITVQKNGLNINGVVVEVDNSAMNGYMFILDKNNEIREVDFENLTTNIVSEDNNSWKSGTQSLDGHLHHLIHENKTHEKYIIVENYNWSGVNVGRAYYDIEKDRFIFINLLNKNNHNMIIGAVLDEVAYFYSTEDSIIYKVNISNGNVIGNYSLASLNNGFFSLDKVWVDDGNVNLSCSFKQNEKLVTASYYITENGISLLSISSDVALVDKLKESPIKIAKSESMMLFRHYVLGMTINGDETYFTNSDVANFIMISGTDSKGLEHNYWFRNQDGALIKPNIPISEDKDSKLEQADSTSLSQNIMLVGFLIDDDNEVFYFYNRASQMIYRQEMNFQKSYSSLSRNISIPNLQDVTFWQGNILAVDKAGVVYQIKVNGEFEQVALNESWFVSHPHWWVNLDKDFDKSSTMTLLGIKPINSKEIIPAWYMNGKVFIAHDLPSSSVLKTFGVDGNNSELLIFDIDSKKLYLQPSATTEQLIAAFDVGSKIMNPSSLPSIVELYPNTRFKKVEKIGTGLLMLTVNDEIIYHEISANKKLPGEGGQIGTSIIIKGTKDNDLLIPSVMTGVKNLVLSGGEGTDNYVLTAHVWQNYETIVIDNYASDNLIDTIVLPVDNFDSLLINQNENDLVLTDTDTNTVLILRQVFGPQGGSHQHIQVSFLNGSKPYFISELVENSSFKYKLKEYDALDKASTYDANYYGSLNENNSDMLIDHIVPFDSGESLSEGGIGREWGQIQYPVNLTSRFNFKQ